MKENSCLSSPWWELLQDTSVALRLSPLSSFSLLSSSAFSGRSSSSVNDGVVTLSVLPVLPSWCKHFSSSNRSFGLQLSSSQSDRDSSEQANFWLCGFCRGRSSSNWQTGLKCAFTTMQSPCLLCILPMVPRWEKAPEHHSQAPNVDSAGKREDMVARRTGLL